MFHKLGLGTWQMGGKAERDPNNDDARDITAIQNAIQAGIKHIDTAEYYADGKAEELVGAAIKDFNRRNLFIASKVRDKLHYDEVLENCEKSLKRLGIDQLDLYYVHRPSLSIPIEETAKAFNHLVEQKMIKHVGLSNASLETMMLYKRELDVPIFASQCHYNLLIRKPEVLDMFPYCQREGINLIAFRPIQLPIPELGVKSLVEKGAYPLLDEMAEKYGKSNAQIAVRWLTHQKGISVVFKTSNPDHLQEIVGAEKFDIEPSDMQRLTDDFPVFSDAQVLKTVSPIT